MERHRDKAPLHRWQAECTSMTSLRKEKDLVCLYHRGAGAAVLTLMVTFVDDGTLGCLSTSEKLTIMDREVCQIYGW